MGIKFRNPFSRDGSGLARELLERGIAAEQAGAPAQAMEHYRKAAETDPSLAAAHFNLGLLLVQAADFDEAEAALRAALQARNDFPEAWVALADAFEAQGRDSEAVEALDRAIALRERYEGALMNAAVLLQKLGRLDEAASRYRQVLELAPEAAALHNNLANVLQALGRLGEAEASGRRAVGLDPALPEAHFNLGNILQALGRGSEAEASLRNALRLRPAYREAHVGLGNALRDLGRVDEAQAAFLRALDLDPDDRDARSNYLLSLNYTRALTRAEVHAAHAEWARRHAVAESHVPPPNVRDPARRLRIGYVSGDFRRHSVAYFIEPVLAQHDRGAFEVFCYSNVALADAMTGRLMALADHAREIVHLSDEAVAAMIRADAIDILVDLAGHTAGHRLGVFALRPAPVQATYLGYPNTTGLAAIGWRVTDTYADPPGDGDDVHSERLARLPRSFLCFQPPDGAPVVQAPPCAERGHVTFGSFNVLPKVTPEVIRVWSQVLGRVPGSRLLLKALGLGDAHSREQVLARFAAHGIAAERIMVLPMEASLQAHLARYHEIDIALDPFPFNGTTTTLEALWMGVPVVALAGDRHSARVGASILANAGLSELIAPDEKAYVDLAARLAGDASRLADLRRGMRTRIAASPLRDPAGIVGDLEQAYRRMWSDWCAAKPVTGSG